MGTRLPRGSSQRQRREVEVLGDHHHHFAVDDEKRFAFHRFLQLILELVLHTLASGEFIERAPRKGRRVHAFSTQKINYVLGYDDRAFGQLGLSGGT